MSTFGKYGVGGSVSGKYTIPPEENSGGFDYSAAAEGTDAGNPDSKPTAAPGTFGAPEHNKANMNPKGSS